ncbi:hypothetical protein AN958_10940 [Leucoagaricus sp. SymC.cos]|nr:hypothetical protein AN958_10940 [Leucoagaricus sp. SymC.cos]
MKLQRISLILLPFLSLVSASSSEQIIMGSSKPPFDPEIRPKPTLADLLTIDQSVSIFYSYARELELSRMFNDESLKSTLLVPTNKAVMAVARKPHQGQGSNIIPDDVHITDEEYDKKSKANVERWISAHIIPVSPITLDSSAHQTMLDGKSVFFKPISKIGDEAPEWSRVTLENGIHITDMKQASNGVIYVIDGTISTE